jgi:thiol-disulfide isomerase/thioredoxin
MSDPDLWSGVADGNLEIADGVTSRGSKGRVSALERLMRGRRSKSTFFVGILASTWVALALAGCSEEEPLVPDPGASPFYPGPAAQGGATARPDPGGDTPIGQPRVSSSAASPAGASVSGKPLEPADIDRQLKIAVRTAQKGDLVKTAELLDQVLAVDPRNREALVMRAALALDQSSRAQSTEDRAAAVAQATVFVRTLIRATESPSPSELDIFARVLYEQARLFVVQGQNEKALALLREIVESGRDAFARVETDPAMARLRSAPEFKQAREAAQKSSLTQARERVKDRLQKPLDFAFDLILPNLDGKPVALSEFKGKVVLVDFWGTWCGPCKKAIPHLIDLYKKRHHRGLEIVGLSYEKDVATPEQALALVKAFVQQAGIPYPCLLGDEKTVLQIPNFKGFPTSVVLDRAGKVRLLITENDANSLQQIEDVVEVLLAAPETYDAAAAKKP